MSNLLNLLILSIQNPVFLKKNLDTCFNSLVELVDSHIIDKDYVFDQPFNLNIENSLTKKEYTQINSLKDLFLFIQQYEKVNYTNTQFHDFMTTNIKHLYDIVDYNLYFKVKLNNIQLYNKSSDSQNKLSELLSAIPKEELNTILKNADPDDQKQRDTRDLLLHVLFSSSVSDIFFKYIDRNVFLNTLKKIKKIENNELYHYITQNKYVQSDQNKEIEHLLHGLDKYAEIHEHVIFGKKAILHNFLKEKNSFRLIINNFQSFDSTMKNQIRNYVFESFFNKKYQINKPSILDLNKVDNLFYERPEFDEDLFITILKHEPKPFFVLLDNDRNFKSHIEKMHFNLFSYLIDVHHITKENFQFFVKQHPELLSQSKNKQNNLTNFLITEEGRFADWYKMRLYMFEKLNLETFAKECDNVYLNLFNQNFYFSLFADSSLISNKQLNERAKKVFVNKLIQYEKSHNIQECFSKDYFEVIDISYAYFQKPNKENAQHVLDKLKDIPAELTFNILGAKGYIEKLCENDQNKQFKETLYILLEKLSLNQSISVDTVIKPEIHRI